MHALYAGMSNKLQSQYLSFFSVFLHLGISLTDKIIVTEKSIKSILLYSISNFNLNIYKKKKKKKKL